MSALLYLSPRVCVCVYDIRMVAGWPQLHRNGAEIPRRRCEARACMCKITSAKRSEQQQKHEQKQKKTTKKKLKEYFLFDFLFASAILHVCDCVAQYIDWFLRAVFKR